MVPAALDRRRMVSQAGKDARAQYDKMLGLVMRCMTSPSLSMVIMLVPSDDNCASYDSREPRTVSQAQYKKCLSIGVRKVAMALVQMDGRSRQIRQRVGT
jgi:hypothetical protein